MGTLYVAATLPRYSFPLEGRRCKGTMSQRIWHTHKPKSFNTRLVHIRSHNNK